MSGGALVALKWHDSAMGWLVRVDARAGDGSHARIQLQHNVDIWEEAHREPPAATGQLIPKGYSGSSAMRCTL